MCGICGIVSSIDRTREVRIMTSSLEHRGPDENNVLYTQGCTLGHSRLSIVDLEGGKQPMSNQKGNITLTFNGEIYGYKEIKEKIKYNYITKSDTELIIALYEKYDDKMLSHLPGMFSFALWDERKQVLFCARDRFGEKPFFYAFSDTKELIIASEIKAIIHSGLITPRISRQNLSYLLQQEYFETGKTIFENIYSLPPAHYLIFQNGEITTDRYWEYPKINNNLSYNEAKEEFEFLFKRAIEKQLIADVEVSCFLSGGLDSGSITTIASSINPDLRTISFGFKGMLNELPYASLVAKKNNTNHHELAELDYNLKDIILKLPEIYDEPFFDSSSLPTYIISKHARKFGKVVLTGDGGDEMLGGYTWIFHDLLQMLELQNSSILKKSIVNGKAYTEKVLNILKLTDLYKWRRVRYGLSNNKRFDNIFERYISHKIKINNDELKLLNLPQVYYPIVQDPNNINSVFRHVIENYMANDILIKTDRASMANSLELRSPFLDTDLANFCIGLPHEYKCNLKNTKIILKDTIGRELPSQILKKPKQGFGEPNNWEKNKEVLFLKKEFLDDPSKKLYSYLSYNVIQKIIEQKKDFWNLLIFSIWFEKNYQYA